MAPTDRIEKTNGSVAGAKPTQAQSKENIFLFVPNLIGIQHSGRITMAECS